MEAFPPFTVVNGKVWPVLDVQPATYRFRVLNGSNARTYRLVLLRDGAPELGRITQIGTDHGLLRTPVPVPADGLVLASAERADLLVDFSDLAPGSELTVLNTAAAPFDGSSFPAADAENAADLESLLPYPQVLRFRVVGEAKPPAPIPRELVTDYELPAAEALAGARRRAIALVERESDDEPSMLTMRELAVATDADGGPRVTRHRRRRNHRYRVVAAHFEDMTTFFPMLGEYEVWQLINLTGDTHPIHLHLDPFQILARHPIRYEIPEDGIEDRDLAATITLERDPDDELDHAIDDNERGLKDTIRVNPNEIVEIAVRFTTYSGRYMYHCHILEHEDRDMMRPFVTMASELMPFTGLRSAHDTSESTSPSRARRARALSSYSRLLDEAVRVARRVPALQAGLVHAQTAEVVAVREEPRVDGHAAGRLCPRRCGPSRRPRRPGRRCRPTSRRASW